MPSLGDRMMRGTPLVVAAAAAALLAGCGSTNVDTAAMERQLQQRVTRDLGLSPGKVKASCPRQEEATVGNTFTCTLSYDGDERTFVIRLEDGGRYTARPRTTTTQP
jgi:hypothetical protein